MTKCAGSKRKIFAELMKQARERKGLTQTEAAEAIGVNRTHLSAIENGKEKNPRADLLKKAGEVYNLTGNEILESL